MILGYVRTDNRRQHNLLAVVARCGIGRQRQRRRLRLRKHRDGAGGAWWVLAVSGIARVNIMGACAHDGHAIEGGCRRLLGHLRQQHISHGACFNSPDNVCEPVCINIRNRDIRLP